MSDNLQGVLWALVSAALGTIAAVMVKFVVGDFHVLQILFIRHVIVFISVLPKLVTNFPHHLKTDYPVTHGVRLGGAFVALSCGVWALAVLPLTTATTLGFSQVFFVALFAAKYLGEPIGLTRIVAIVIGFAGVLVVMRPGFDVALGVNAIIPIVGAMGAATAITCVRKLSRTESTVTLLSYQAVFVGSLSGVPMIWLWVTPTWPTLLLMVGIGILATAAQRAGIKALSKGEASLVSSMAYVQLIYAALLGYILFSEIPNVSTLIGAALIIGSAIYSIRTLAERRTRSG